MQKRTIVLASSSPRRRELLERAGVVFTVDPPNIEENMRRKLTVRELVKTLALEKASEVALRRKNAIVIGADTIVSIGNYKWSKPENEEEARRMLQTLSGKSHSVWTGFCIIDTKSGKRIQRAVKTEVTVRVLSSQEIKRYIETGESLDGAGGYKMQGTGGFVIEKIHGDYTNVLGLPLSAVLDELKKMGIRA